MVRLHFSVIFFLIFSPCFLFFIGCGSDPEPDALLVEEPSVSIEAQPMRPLTPDETFVKLKALYPNDVLGEELETLGALTETRTYLNFLSHTYGVEEAFLTFADFLEIAQPDPQQYLAFLEQFVEDPTEEDVSVLHNAIQDYRTGNALNYKELDVRHLLGGDDGGVWLLLKFLKRQLTPLSDAEFTAWMERRVGNQGEGNDFLVGLDTFVVELEKSDTVRIQELFTAYGENDGTIWLAIRDPLLTGQILKDFTSKRVFLRWVAGDFFDEMP